MDDRDKKETGSKRRRRNLSAEKKYQIFLETQAKDCSVGEVLRREGMYSTDLIRIREQVREAALERLGQKSGPKKKSLEIQKHEALKKEFAEKERAMSELIIELAIMRKKTDGGTWER